MEDVIIIGGGIIGSLIARELSFYEISVLLLDKEEDIPMGSTKANSAIVHAGYDPLPGTLKAKTNVEGNRLYKDLCNELKVPFKRIGAYVLAFNDEELKILLELKERGKINGVSEIQLLKREEILKREPNINREVKYALFFPTSGITNPFLLTIHALENAIENGVQVKLGEEVIRIENNNIGYKVTTNKSKYYCKYIINCAGIYADKIIHLLDPDYPFAITPRKGEYLVLDNKAQNFVKSTIFHVPTQKGKGVLVTPTVDGNILLGPTAENIANKEDKSISMEGLSEIKEKVKKLTPNVPFTLVINIFSGIRASSTYKDFFVQEIPEFKNILHFAGIDSPGLTSAPSLDKMAVEWLMEKENIKRKRNIKNFEKIVAFKELTEEEKENLIKEDPRWGHIICRCEYVSEMEVRNAINSPLPARNLEAIKKRTRAGMGRCQGAFCSYHIMKILSDELEIPMNMITLRGGKSFLLNGENKVRWKYAKRS